MTLRKAEVSRKLSVESAAELRTNWLLSDVDSEDESGQESSWSGEKEVVGRIFHSEWHRYGRWICFDNVRVTGRNLPRLSRRKWRRFARIAVATRPDINANAVNSSIPPPEFGRLSPNKKNFQVTALSGEIDTGAKHSEDLQQRSTFTTMTTEDNGNVGLLKPTSSSNEDLSEYTDADESISAPTEFLAEAMDEEMKKMLEKIMEDVGEIKEENRKMSRELEQLKSMMREKEEKWEREKMELKEKMTKLEEKMEEQEKRVRKKNIVVTGLDEEECENEKKLEKWMKAELEVEVRVKEMYKINGGKMIVAELESWGEKRKVMENKLREKKGKRVYIEDDMTKKERDTQKKLRTLAKEEREKGLRVKGRKGKTNMERNKGENEQIRIVFWNVAEIKNKENEFWKYLGEFDVVGLVETWVEEKGWERLEKRMPREFEWKCQYAERESKKGRAKGGIIMGVKKGLEEENGSGVKEERGFMERTVKRKQRKWRIVTIYSRSMKETKRIIEERVKEQEEGTLVIGGDFNARIGGKGRRMEEQQATIERRPTKDGIENAEGRELVSLVEERGWDVLNGNCIGDEKGEYTYIGSRGETVIDYVMVNEEAWDKIEEFKVGERVESDHMPLEVRTKGREQERSMKDVKRKIVKNIWTEEGKEKYRARLREAKYEEGEINEKVRELSENVKNATEKKEIEIREKMGLWKNEWWDKECREGKQAARKKLRNWKKEKATKEEYKRARKRYKLVCKEKKEKKRMEEEMKMKGIKTEEEVWRYINRERKKKGEIVSDRITMEEWRKYFSELLGGEENRQEKEKRQHRVGEIEEITREELEQQLRKLKRKKAPGRDGIQNESWMYGTEREVDKLLEIMNGVWKGEGFPQEWKEGIICPIYKKGEKDTASNYRGITLLNTAYKVYAMIVEERLMKEMNERGALPDGQAGFRKDLKAAFDNVERDLLWEYLRKKGINEHLVTKIEEIYEETISRVRVDGRVSECFKTYKGVRQGCPLSPSLFAAFIGDIEEMFRKGQAGGVVVGKEKVWSLAYADDLVVLAREEKGMKEMLGNMEKYMRRKKLTVNVEKSKMMVFRKGGGRRKINEWRWEKDKIEEVKEFKYLGYVMNERNTAAAHVRELVKKANKIIGAVWGIGERKFGHDFRRRIMMFDSLVKSVMMYGAEIWGWREQEGLEGVQGKYLKWVLGVDRETPGYIVMEETKRDGIRIEAGKRAIRFEERLIERGECRILQECLKEKRKEIGKGVWKEREAYFERNGYAGAEIERMREGGRAMTYELVQRDRDVQVQERRTRIRESRYNEKYEKIITEELPKYLGRESRKERVIIARFRCGNEERENKYWNEDRIRVCRMCGEKKETIEHMLNECVELREREESREEMLNEDGRGIEWMKKFLSAVMMKDYVTALKYCKLILQYEPNNATAKEFYPLILEKLQQSKYRRTVTARICIISSIVARLKLLYVFHPPATASEDGSSNDSDGEDDASEENGSSSSSSDSDSSSSSEESSDGQEEEEEEEEEVEVGRGDKQSKGSSDGDATTGSYSSLEDDEAETDHLAALAAKYQIDNVNLGNGNKIFDEPRCPKGF
ncbi:hypothetical protein GEV33_012716 [Tenebrio molitor]|uniref:Reverse transcriptase domain-containing protein n=1 Tax=Tenebrio molitor TaxID=7067 RepID=A0A8J6H8L8_TENMO|nr:hypothetical protein GEV33_012716 [Tenebrio molitor]